MIIKYHQYIRASARHHPRLPTNKIQYPIKHHTVPYPITAKDTNYVVPPPDDVSVDHEILSVLSVLDSLSDFKIAESGEEFKASNAFGFWPEEREGLGFFFLVHRGELFREFMGSFENPNWLLECPLIDELPVSAGDFYWNSQGFNSSSSASVEIDSSFVDSDGLKESGSQKRTRAITSNEPGSKACREKMRRDRLNDKFLELGSILEPGKKPKMDKTAILSDAARMVTGLRSEAQKLKDSNDNFQEKIKELKTEKNELRDEKQKLKAEKENLERQIKFMNSRPSFLPPPSVIPAAFAAQDKGASSPATNHKLMMPIIGYPGFPMWQFMPPSDVDTSQDTESCPPVA